MSYVQQLLSTLNDQQKKAVLHETGPAIVLAGAGSGKTKVLTSRASWLIKEKNFNPEQILLVTFTNKASSEMNKRVMEQTGFRLPFSGTFHSLCAKILRRDASHLGLSQSFTIFDSNDQLALIKQVYKKNNFDDKKYKPQVIKANISQIKNEVISPEKYKEIAGDEFQEFTAKVYDKYQKELMAQQAVDFDDLMLLVLDLFRKFPQVLQKYQRQISHVLVDEYQDTNKAQYHLTKYFAESSNNLYVVGDFSQSIYSWRGADYRNLMHLKQDFDKVTEYKLEQNYRSTQTILDAATQVISFNASHPVLKLWTENSNQDKIIVLDTESGEDEAKKVAEAIRKNLSEFQYSDMAILYRTNAQSRQFEETFIRSSIPYKIVGGLKFYERKEIKDVLAYLRFLVNPMDMVSFERSQKLGKRRFKIFQEWIANQPVSFENESPFGTLEKIINVTDYYSKFDAKDPEDQVRIDNVKELLNVSSQFKNITDFLENIALIQDGYFHEQTKENPEQDLHNSVSLMSIHSAKGLEFPIVFLVGMEEGLLPHSRSLWEKDQMEEERRLCYVGITRAKKKLYFSYAKTRWQYGQPSNSIPSRFISEISKDLLDESSKYNLNYASNEPKIILDDDTFDAIMNDEMDIKKFLDF